MNKNNVKCPICGYVFETDTTIIKNTCPLCSSEYDISQAVKLYDDMRVNETPLESKSKSRGKILAEWAVFFVSFSAFIIILYFIISYILEK